MKYGSDYNERIEVIMKKILIFSYIFVLTLCLTSCAGTGDWTYKLPNNYEVQHINSKDIVIKCVDSEEASEMIPSFVKEFSYDERYIYSRNIEDISSNNVTEEIYYAIDTLERKVTVLRNYRKKQMNGMLFFRKNGTEHLPIQT